jgi:hypothetical protein
MLEGSAFEPEQIAVLTESYERTLKALALADRADPITELVAKKVIEIAQTGHRDAARISALVVEALGIAADK